MLRVFADDHDFAFSLDDLALLADLLDGWFYLHCGAAPSVARSRGSFRTPCDASLCQVVNRHFNGHAVTGQYLDIIHSQLAGNMRCHHMSVRELDPEARVRERFHDHAFKLDDIILLCQNNPSLPAT